MWIIVNLLNKNFYKEISVILIVHHRVFGMHFLNCVAIFCYSWSWQIHSKFRKLINANVVLTSSWSDIFWTKIIQIMKQQFFVLKISYTFLFFLHFLKKYFHIQFHFLGMYHMWIHTLYLLFAHIIHTFLLFSDFCLENLLMVLYGPTWSGIFLSNPVMYCMVLQG